MNKMTDTLQERAKKVEEVEDWHGYMEQVDSEVVWDLHLLIAAQASALQVAEDKVKELEKVAEFALRAITVRGVEERMDRDDKTTLADFGFLYDNVKKYPMQKAFEMLQQTLTINNVKE